MFEPTYTLLATLGGQPQVVTFTLDLLLQQGARISEVIVIHPAPIQESLKRSLACLQAEFRNDSYNWQGKSLRCRFYSHILRRNGEPLPDIVDGQCAEGVVETVHYLIQDLKQQGRSVHLSISGGRRMIASLAISAAQLHFSNTDHIWHIYTPDETKSIVRDGAMMHVEQEQGVQLIEVPLLFQSLNGETLQATQWEHDQATRKEQFKRCDTVVEMASSVERKVLRLFARGLNPQQVAAELEREIKTIDSHKTKLLGYCYEVWQINEKKLTYRFLQEQFADYFKEKDKQ